MAEPTLRVLLIDDSEDDYRLTQRILGDARFERFALDWIEGFDDGLAAVQSNSHDAYLIDHKLKTRSGLELIREAVRSGAIAPMILLTGHGDDGVHLDSITSS
jgi:DNA-binding response OmpR family regulator